MNRFFILIFLLFYLLPTHSQEITQGYFRSPLDIPLFLSGNFGELRSNHFHAGLDIKTQGVTGQKVYAVADGYVSRIKVSPYGYGNALYVTHPNGYTSVYGHLEKYSDKITEVVKDYQYKKESFSVQLFPTLYQIPVKKGEIIAYSGNSGGSGGPHLHFEIRDTKTEHPYNPLFFGFDIKDNVKPDIYALTIYPLNDTSTVDGTNKERRYIARGSNGKYYLPLKKPIEVSGEIGFGIETVDRMSGTSNRYGLHNLQLIIDDELIYEQQIDEFAFHEGRYINSHIDYERYRRNRRRVQKSFVQDGNKLRIYKTLKNKGKLNFDNTGIHEMEYIASDLFENSSTLSFEVMDVSSTKKNVVLLEKEMEEDIQFMPFDKRNTFIRENLLVDLPKGILYEDQYFSFKMDSSHYKTISPIYWLHSHYVPLHSYMTVAIKMKGLPQRLKNKALIASTVDGKFFYAEGGKWNGDNISVKTRSFGGYAVLLDSIAPKVTPITITNNRNMSGKWSISLKVTDDLSGLDYYRGTVDDKWILMQYDAKNDMLTYYFDEKVEKGKHVFKLTVKDGVGNTSTYEANFTR